MTNTLINLLSGKPILLMDDELHTVGDYLLRLENAGVMCEHVKTLDDAWASLMGSPGKYGIVLLDLKMPPANGSTMKEWANKLNLTPTSFNHGQTLGLELWKERSVFKLPYAYLTVLPHLYVPAENEFGDKAPDFIVNKAGILASKLPDRLVKVLKDWSTLSTPTATTQNRVQA